MYASDKLCTPSKYNYEKIINKKKKTRSIFFVYIYTGFYLNEIL